MRPVRRDDHKVRAGAHRAVDRDAHRPRTVRRNGHERAYEVAEGRTDDARARDDALRDVTVDADARRVEEDPAVHLADVDPARLRFGQEAEELRPFARITESPSEIVPRPDWIESQRDVGVDEPVRDLVRRAVAADGDHALVAILDRMGR